MTPLPLLGEGDHTLDILVIIGKHLRYEHNLSRRAVAENLGVKPSWVKKYVEEVV